MFFFSRASRDPRQSSEAARHLVRPRRPRQGGEESGQSETVGGGRGGGRVNSRDQDRHTEAVSEREQFQFTEFLLLILALAGLGKFLLKRN